jgi:predicted nucleic acid-binding protein
VLDAILIDASIFIDNFRGHPDAFRVLDPLLLRGAARLHPVVAAEILEGARDHRHLKAIQRSLAAIPTTVVKTSDFKVALNLLCQHRLATGIGWADCLIAATALRMDLPLVTLNDKHFRPIRGVRVVRPY